MYISRYPKAKLMAYSVMIQLYICTNHTNWYLQIVQTW